MRKGRFSEEQMVAIIREADRDPVAAVAKRHGISEQTTSAGASDVKRLRQLEAENGRLSWWRSAISRSRCRRKKMVSVPARRQQVAYGWERGLSARRACTVFSVARGCACGGAALRLSAHPHFPRPRRPSHEPGPGAPAVANGKAAGAAQAAEEAHRRCAAATSASTEWAEPGVVLRLCVRPLRQRSAAQVPDRRRRVHQGGLAIDADGRIRSARVIEVLSRLVSARAAPRFLRSDNGPESAVMDRRARHRHGIDRTRQALAEWRRRELQRQVPRRVSEP
jgi:putative transposase